MSRLMFTLTFWADAAERAVKSFAQGIVAVWLTSTTPALDASFVAACWAGLAMAVLSVLTSIASVNVGQTGTASMVPGDPPPPQRDRGAGDLTTVLVVLAIIAVAIWIVQAIR